MLFGGMNPFDAESAFAELPEQESGEDTRDHLADAIAAVDSDGMLVHVNLVTGIEADLGTASQPFDGEHGQM